MRKMIVHVVQQGRNRQLLARPLVALAQPVLLVGLHLLEFAWRVTLAKHLLPMAADARCVLPLPAPLRSVQAMPHASSLPIVCTH